MNDDLKLGRVAPHSDEAEVGVLGGLMLEEGKWDDLQLQPEMFYRPSHREIFLGMRALKDKYAPLDPYTLITELESRGTLDKAGGRMSIVSIVERVYTTANLSYYADILREKHLLRRLLDAGNSIIRMVHEPDTDLESLLQASEKAVYDVSRGKQEDNFYTLGELLNKAVTEVGKNDTPGGGGDLSTGFPSLDEHLAGMQRGSLNILAARPSMGKTALALSIAERVARNVLENQHMHGAGPVMVFSLEMPAVQLVLRMLSGATKVDMQRLRTNDLNEYESNAIIQQSHALGDLPIVFSDESNASINSIRSRIKRLSNSEFGAPSLVVIDYLQLMQGRTSRGGGENRQQEISEISRGLKAIAREHNVPVLALSQLSRAVESRDNKTPRLSDLRESGAIEQDADVVMFIYRDDYYAEREGRESSKLGVAEVIIAKNRNGPIGSADLFFNSQHVTFKDPKDH